MSGTLHVETMPGQMGWFEFCFETIINASKRRQYGGSFEQVNTSIMKLVERPMRSACEQKKMRRVT